MDISQPNAKKILEYLPYVAHYNKIATEVSGVD